MHGLPVEINSQKRFRISNEPIHLIPNKGYKNNIMKKYEKENKFFWIADPSILINYHLVENSERKNLDALKSYSNQLEKNKVDTGHHRDRAK